MKKFAALLLVIVAFACVMPASAAVFAGQAHYITLTHGQKNFKINLSDYEIKTNNFAILSSSRRKIKGRTVEEKINYMIKLNSNGVSPAHAVTQVFLGIENEINKIAGQIEKTAVNSQMKFNPKNNAFSFTAEKTGIKVEKNTLYNALFNALTTGKNKVEIKTSITQPKLSASMLKDATFARAGFETNCENSSPERKHNIALALSKINGKVINPGEIFSFNTATGKRREQDGYKMAKVILNGTFAEGFGGGVCQVSTTLYNSALLNGLDVVYSRGHSLPVSYVPSGLDAMISEGSADLIIKNNLKLPVAIKATTNGKTIKIEFFGQSMEGSTYELITEVTREIPPKQPEFKKESGVKKGTILREGFNGFATQSYRNHYKNGRLVNTERIRRTTYDSVAEIISA